MEVVRSARMVLSQWKKAQDAAIFEQEGHFGFGCVARNHEGTVIDVYADYRQGHVKPQLAELMGIREALSWIKRKGWHGVVIESDCLVAVQATGGLSHMVSSFGLILEDCRLMLESLSDVCLRFVKRSANSAAHCIARASYCELGVHNLSPEFYDIGS